VEAVQAGALKNGFALVRPPGHHAESNRAMGFCVFNNIAIGAATLLQNYPLDRILIVDWDLHHGNATQHSFYDSAQVLYFSTHQYPYYPGTGSVDEVGAGAGRGYTVNVPLAPGAGDDEFMSIFRYILQPIAREFCPDFVLLSAGFDTYFQDPLGGMRVTPQGYAGLTQVLLEIAEELCQGKLAVTLEGGYSLEGLRDSVKEVLLELDRGFRPLQSSQESSGQIDSIVGEVRSIHQQFWKCFS
jgi:acetoin utilization deacetylase AcuC-like enzyme